MSALCLVAASSLFLIPSSHITLAWTHSIEKVRWEEDYRNVDGRLVLEAARVRGSGAGMEPGPGAVLRDGWWHYRPQTPSTPEVLLARSEFSDDYEVCWDGRCHPMQALLARGAGPTRLQPCRG